MIYVISRKLRIQEMLKIHQLSSISIFSSSLVMPKAITLPGNVVISFPPINDFLFFVFYHYLKNTLFG